MSLDGFIAGPNGETDWIARDPDFNFAALYAEFDTASVGRRTFEEMSAKGIGLPGMRLFVFSRTLRPADCPNAILGRDPAAIAEIRASAGKDIWLFGGGALFTSLIELGLVDSVELAVSPVLLGSGLRLRQGAASCVKLALNSQRAYPKSGMVRLAYTVSR
jgi:dihydrofolate reductase